jgi:hypothetical protein
MMPATLPVSYTSVGYIGSAFPAVFSAANVTSAVVAHYAGMEEAIINAKLAKLYALPFTQEVPLLTALSTDLTIAAILTKRTAAHFTTEQNQANPFIATRKRAMDMVEQIAKGELALLSASGQIIETSNEGIEVWTSTMDYKSTFHEGRIEDMIVDPDKLDNILSDRGLM